MTLRVIGLMLALGVIGLTAACDNTIRGVGRDAEETGDAIEDAVE